MQSKPENKFDSRFYLYTLFYPGNRPSGVFYFAGGDMGQNAVFLYHRRIILRYRTYGLKAGGKTKDGLKGKRRMEHVSILLCARRIEFENESVRITDTQMNEYIIPYEEIVTVNIVLQEEDGFHAVELEDVTVDMKGALVICNRRQNFFEIHTDAVGKTEGEIFIELAKYTPCALFGCQPWINPYDSGQFEEMLEMVDLMRDCSGQS